MLILMRDLGLLGNHTMMLPSGKFPGESAKVAAIIQGGGLARTELQGLARFPRDILPRRQSVTLSFRVSHWEELIFLSIAV